MMDVVIGKSPGVHTEIGVLYYWREQVCHDCSAKPGELHKLGCDMERCPFCGRQLISCGEKHFKWAEAGVRPRIPYIQRITNCSVCGVLWPGFFSVPDSEWDKYVPPHLLSTVMCRSCYNGLKEMFPKGWRLV